MKVANGKGYQEQRNSGSQQRISEYRKNCMKEEVQVCMRTAGTGTTEIAETRKTECYTANKKMGAKVPESRKLRRSSPLNTRRLL
jgi:hypothetical protein